MNKEKDIQVFMFLFLLFRLILFVLSHYLFMTTDYVTHGVSIYQRYYYPMIQSFELEISTAIITVMVFIQKIHPMTKIICLALFAIDFLTAFLTAFGFNFELYTSVVYAIYGCTIALLFINFIKKYIN